MENKLKKDSMKSPQIPAAAVASMRITAMMSMKNMTTRLCTITMMSTVCGCENHEYEDHEHEHEHHHHHGALRLWL